MTIVVVNDFAHVNGGAAHVAITGALEMARRGCRVEFFSAVGPVAEELIGVPNLTVHCLGQSDILRDGNRLRAAWTGIWNARAATELVKLLSRLDAAQTVVHLHGWSKALSASVVPAAVKRGFQVVATLHDYFAACPNGAFYHYDAGSICRLKPMGAACIASSCDARHYGHKLWRVARQGVQASLGGIPTALKDFIYLSETSVRALRPYLPANARFHYVANPISVPRSAAVPVAANAAFVSVGRLSREKGHDLLASAAVGLGAPIVFVGDGEMRAPLERTLPQARITGWVSQEEVLRELSQARALVFPSRWYECQPLVVLEAAARGIPAIVPDTSAASELIVPETTGLLFRGGDASSLRRQLIRLRDPDMAATLGAAAYARYWASPFTVERHGDRLNEVYRTILSDADSTEVSP